MIIGIDVGGTGIKHGLVSEEGQLFHFNTVATEAWKGPDHVIDRIAFCIQNLRDISHAESYEVYGIGIGFPGPLNPKSGLILNAPNMPGFVNIPLRDRIRERFNIPTTLENDANAAVYGEWWCGSGKGSQNMIGLTLGTGVGGGIILHGRLYSGVDGTAGEMGHMTVEPDGFLCNCGNRGCLETLASGTSLVRRAREALNNGARSILTEMVGNDLTRLTPKMVHDAQLQGDELGDQIMNETARYLGIAIANLINLFNPEVVSLAGGVANAGDDLFNPLREEVKKRAFERPARTARIVQAVLTETAGTIGAAGVACSNR